MSLLTTHFSRAYSPHVAFNSVTGLGRPNSKPAMAGERYNTLGFFVGHSVRCYDGLGGDAFGCAGSLFPVDQAHPVRHPFLVAPVAGFKPKTRRPIMATLSLRDRTNKLNPLLSSCGKADTPTPTQADLELEARIKAATDLSEIMILVKQHNPKYAEHMDRKRIDRINKELF
jgi:hypothetical protein